MRLMDGLFNDWGVKQGRGGHLSRFDKTQLRAAIFALMIWARLVVTRLITAGLVVARLIIARLICAGALIAGLIIAGLIIALLVIAGAIVAARLIIAGLIIARLIIAAVLCALWQFNRKTVDGIDHLKGNGIGLFAIIGRVLALIRAAVRAEIGAILILAVLAVILLAAFLFRRHFAHRFGQHTGVMFGMLRKVFGRNTIIRSLRIARKHLVFFDDLLRRAANLALGAGTVENTVDDIA